MPSMWFTGSLRSWPGDRLSRLTMTLRKSDLYGSLWRSCDELRGGMDATQYKDYILTLLFVKYVSDKQKADPDSLIVVPSGGSFDDMVALKGDKEIGEKINEIIAKLAEANGLQKVIDQADFNDEDKLGKGKEMQDLLSKLVAIFADLDFRGSRAEGDDLLGDAYEYLMRHFALGTGTTIPLGGGVCRAVDQPPAALYAKRRTSCKPRIAAWFKLPSG
jgi:type I restriction enzyme M protein